MSDKQQDQHDADYSHELYEEPPRTSRGSMLGVFAALVALVIIGLAGYIWLTPGLTFDNLLHRQGATRQTPVQANVSDDAQSSVAEHNIEAVSQQSSSMECPYCGMLADAGGTHVIALWSDDRQTHHDSWDCAFGYGKDEDLELVSAQVNLHGTAPEDPDWLDAASAWFLYDTDKQIKLSMPPYVAAFASRADAEAMRPEWGGKVVDFAGLQAHWE